MPNWCVGTSTSSDSAALRRLNQDPHLAQDAAQTVFTGLARKAAALSRRATLSGWLYTSAHFTAAEIARMESRRRRREENFMREPVSNGPAEPDWQRVRPVLDEANARTQGSRPRGDTAAIF